MLQYVGIDIYQSIIVLISPWNKVWNCSPACHFVCGYHWNANCKRWLLLSYPFLVLIRLKQSYGSLCTLRVLLCAIFNKIKSYCFDLIQKLIVQLKVMVECPYVCRLQLYKCVLRLGMTNEWYSGNDACCTDSGDGWGCRGGTPQPIFILVLLAPA